MENNPYFNKIVGVPSTASSEAKIKLNEWINKGVALGREEFIENYEVKKSDRELHLINFVEKSVDNIAKKYGATKLKEVPVDAIHILKSGGTAEYSDGRFIHGGYSPQTQSVFVDRSASEVNFCLVLFHELLHLKSYSALQVVYDGQGKLDVLPYRSGVSMISRDGEFRYFQAIEEGIVAKLTNEYCTEVLRTDPQFKHELVRIDEGYTELYTSRDIEITTLDTIAEKIAETHKNRFSNSQDVISDFYHAQFSGKLVNILKLVIETFGSDAVRNMGEGID